MLGVMVAVWEAEQIVHKDSLPDVISYRSAISASDQCEQWQQTLALLVEMRHRELLPDVISYNVAVKACVKSGQRQHALGLLSKKAKQ